MEDYFSILKRHLIRVTIQRLIIFYTWMCIQTRFILALGLQGICWQFLVCWGKNSFWRLKMCSLQYSGSTSYLFQCREPLNTVHKNVHSHSTPLQLGNLCSFVGVCRFVSLSRHNRQCLSTYFMYLCTPRIDIILSLPFWLHLTWPIISPMLKIYLCWNLNSIPIWIMTRAS